MARYFCAINAARDSLEWRWMLPDSFGRMGARRNSVESQLLGLYAPGFKTWSRFSETSGQSFCKMV